MIQREGLSENFCHRVGHAPAPPAKSFQNHVWFALEIKANRLDEKCERVAERLEGKHQKGSKKPPRIEQRSHCELGLDAKGRLCWGLP